MGGGFVLNYYGSLSIATAAHVVLEYNRGFGLGVRVGGQHLSLDSVEALLNKDQDIAFIPFSNDFLGRKYYPLIAGKRDDAIATSSFMILGLPESRNRLDIRDSRATFNMLNVMVHSFEYDRKAGDLIFPYDPKSVFIEPGSSQKNIGSLRGLSGAPVAQILIVKKTGALTLRPVGVFKEWRQHSVKRLVASSFRDFSDELDEMIDAGDFAATSNFSYIDVV